MIAVKRSPPRRATVAAASCTTRERNQESDDAFRGRAIKRQRIQLGICAAFSLSECRCDDPGKQKADYKDYDSASGVA
jgi:hypothetical protein